MVVRTLLNHREKQFGETILPLLFFALFFCYLYFIIDPRTIYAFNGSSNYAYLLELRWEFFRDLVTVPGGLITWLMGVITHACHEPWMGSALLTLVGIGFFVLSKFLFKNSGITLYFPLAYLPALTIIYFYGSWYHRWLFTLLTVLGALGFAAAYQLLTKKHAAIKIVTAIVLFFIATVTLRHGALLFAFLICQFEFYRNKKQAGLLAASLAVSAVLIEIVGYTIFNWFRLFELSQIALAEPRIWPVYFYFPVIVFLLDSKKRIHRAPKIVTPQKNKKSAVANDRKKNFTMRPKVFSAIASCLFLLFTMGLGALFVDQDRKDLGLRLHYLRAGQWNQILALKNPSPQGSYYLIKLHIANYALAKTGRLSSEMFTLPQSDNPDGLLLFASSLEGSSINAMVWGSAPEVFLQLGALNYAEKFAGEAMGNTGALPYLLRVRALAAMARNQKVTAAVYLKQLSTIPFYRKEAQSLLSALADTSSQGIIQMVNQLHDYQDTVDHHLFSLPEDQILRGLVLSKRHNQMALDYLMAWHLQTKKLFNFYQDLSLLASADSRVMPLHYDEAMVIFSRLNGFGKGEGTFTKTPGHEVWRRMAAFDALYEKCHDAKNPAREMAPAFGSSYFYFFAFGFSGAQQ